MYAIMQFYEGMRVDSKFNDIEDYFNESKGGLDKDDDDIFTYAFSNDMCNISSALEAKRLSIGITDMYSH